MRQRNVFEATEDLYDKVKGSNEVPSQTRGQDTNIKEISTRDWTHIEVIVGDTSVECLNVDRVRRKRSEYIGRRYRNTSIGSLLHVSSYDF